jgi:hypothetical protein
MRSLTPSAFVTLVAALGSTSAGCDKLMAAIDRSDAPDAAPREVVFGDLKLTVAGDATVKEVSGVLEITRKPVPENGFDRDVLAVSKFSQWDYDLRLKSDALQTDLPHGHLGYRIDEGHAGRSPDATLVGSMKVEPDFYGHVTCTVHAVTKAKPTIDWCLTMLRTAAHR